jgi:hypothetical protein
MMDGIPSSQAKTGDQMLERAREIANEYRSMIDQRDLDCIEERIAL